MPLISPETPTDRGTRAVVVTARRLSREFEAARRRDPRSARYRSALEALTGFVEARGGLVQIESMRYSLGVDGGIVRQQVHESLHRSEPPTIV